MAQFITFFPRQSVVGDASANIDLYSDIYDVSSANQVPAELRVYTAGGASCTGQLEQTDDPSMENWSNYGTPMTGNATGTFTGGSTTAMPKRFVRAKLTVAKNASMMIGFTARANC